MRPSAYLREQLALAERAARALAGSCARLAGREPPGEEPGEDELVEWEALTARYARLVDLLTQRVFRAIDADELVDEGSLIDRLNRAEQRGLIDSAERWRELRLLRNQIAHDYVLESLERLFAEVRAAAPETIAALERVRDYLEQRLSH